MSLSNHLSHPKTKTVFTIWLIQILTGKWSIWLKIFLIFSGRTQQTRQHLKIAHNCCLLDLSSFTKCNEPLLSYLFIYVFIYCSFNDIIIVWFHLGLRKTTEDLSQDSVLAMIENGQISNTSQKIYYLNQLARSLVI